VISINQTFASTQWIKGGGEEKEGKEGFIITTLGNSRYQEQGKKE